MKSFSSDFVAHLADETTTLSWCWRITRADCEVLGFTDHDHAIYYGRVMGCGRAPHQCWPELARAASGVGDLRPAGISD